MQAQASHWLQAQASHCLQAPASHCLQAQASHCQQAPASPSQQAPANPSPSETQKAFCLPHSGAKRRGPSASRRPSEVPMLIQRSIAAVSGCVASLALLSACPTPTSGGGTSANAAAIGLPQAEQGSGSPVAHIAGYQLTSGELQARINKQSAFTRARFKDPKEKQKFLENQVKFEVLAKEAAAKGYVSAPDVQDAIKKIIVQRLTREEFDKRLKPGDVTEADMKAYYEKNRDKYHKPEQVRLGVIGIDKGADADAAKARIQEARKEASLEGKLKDRQHFKQVVGKYSTHAATKKTGGDTRYQTQKDLEVLLGKQVADVGWGLTEINAVSDVIETDKAFFIVKRLGFQKERSRPFDKLRTHIKNTLNREARSAAFEAYVEELKTKYKVELFPEKLDEVRVLGTDKPTPMGNLPATHGMPDGHPPH